jgi:N-acetylmuramoyl-L-alanine amidase
VSSQNLSKIGVKKSLLGSGTRLEFEMTPGSAYDISNKGEKIIIRFKRAGDKPSVPPPTSSSSKKAKAADGAKPFVFVIDPGHGGQDEGAVGPGGAKEKDVTLAISKTLAAKLKKLPDTKVYLTRDSDTALTLEDRNAVAVSKKADLFISIHANAAEDHRMSGIETYYLNNATDRAAAKLASRENKASKNKLSAVEHILSTMLQNNDAAESELLARDVQSSLVDRIGKKYKVHNRNVRSALFYVLVGAKCPAILVETSFISNPREEKRLVERSYQSDLATSVADGVLKFIKTSDKRMVSL